MIVCLPMFVFPYLQFWFMSGYWNLCQIINQSICYFRVIIDCYHVILIYYLGTKIQKMLFTIHLQRVTITAFNVPLVYQYCNCYRSINSTRNWVIYLQAYDRSDDSSLLSSSKYTLLFATGYFFRLTRYSHF